MPCCAALACVRFAKIKYILNGLSAGHDVVFLDTDIIVLQDPLPYFLGRGADMWAAHEKCVIWDDRANMLSLPPELQVGQRFGIGTDWGQDSLRASSK